MNWHKGNLMLAVFVLSTTSLQVSASTELDNEKHGSPHLYDVISNKMTLHLADANTNRKSADFSDFQQQATQTRAGSYLVKANREAVLAACPMSAIERESHIDLMADKLSLIGDARTAFIERVNQQINRGTIC